MNTYPSYLWTHTRVFILISNIFIWALPLLLVNISIAYFSYWIYEEINGFALFLSIILSSITWGILLDGMYNKLHNNASNYLCSLKNTLKRFPWLFISGFSLLILFSILFTVPILIGSIVVEIFPEYIVPLYILGIIFFLSILFISCYFCLSGVLILKKNRGPFGGILHSYRLVKGYAFKTFLLMLPYLMISITVLFLGEYLSLIGAALSTLLLIALVVIHCDQLERLKQKDIKSFSVAP